MPRRVSSHYNHLCATKEAALALFQRQRLPCIVDGSAHNSPQRTQIPSYVTKPLAELGKQMKSVPAKRLPSATARRLQGTVFPRFPFLYLPPERWTLNEATASHSSLLRTTCVRADAERTQANSRSGSREYTFDLCLSEHRRPGFIRPSRETGLRGRGGEREQPHSNRCCPQPA